MSNVARAPKRRRASGPSGKNLMRQVALRADDDEIERWDNAAKREGVDRNTWLRGLANERARRALGED